jgi:hypothetical protein
MLAGGYALEASMNPRREGFQPQFIEIHEAQMFSRTERAWKIAVASLVALISLCSLSAAQPVAAPNTPPLTAAQLDRLVAPIALYPDPLVAQILMAATYPLEVVEADRWLRLPANAALKGDALAAALQQQPWDPSVKSLIALPQLLQAMDTNLDWTEQLGDAFLAEHPDVMDLAQHPDIMDAIQRLRLRAQAAGSLASTPQQTVSTENQEIMIEPSSPDTVYVPTYDSSCAYGAWPSTDDPPFAFAPDTGDCTPGGALIDFGAGFIPFGFWAWGNVDWHNHAIRIDHDRFRQFHSDNGNERTGDIWQHDPTHRHGVPYRDPATVARFLGPTGEAVRGYRGFAPAPAATEPATRELAPVGHEATAIIRPAAGPAPPQRPLPPAFESFDRGAEVRGEAARGFSSRMAPPASMPAPRFNAAPMPSFHGGGGRR